MLLDQFRLDEKVALITGAGRGVGRAIAEGLAEVGAETILVSRTEHELKATAKAAGRFGRRAMPIVADIANPEERVALVRSALDRFNQIDILVNAAALGWPGHGPSPGDGESGAKEFLEIPPDEWSQVTTLNLDATASLVQLVAAQMIHLGGGKIINLTTAGGHHATDGFSAYGASKAAIEQLTQTLAHELGHHGIHINCIALGRVVTRVDAETAYWTPERRVEVGKQIAVGRVGDENDVAPLAVYLASNASDYVSGATIALDGGGYIHSALESAP
jgi:7-alpha-hydroxysteroid dehydrogenase